MASSIAATASPGVPTRAPPAATLGRWYAVALGYTLAVVLFGAVVRITGSGAGCGQHWPSCHGEIAHLPGAVETAIELAHRVTSGLSFVLVVGLGLAAFRLLPRGHAARRFAGLASVFMLIEVLIGAVLVLRRLVGEDSSLERAVVGSAHLVNTCLLTGSLLLSLVFSRRPQPVVLCAGRGTWALLAAGGAGILAVCVTGAVTALGDTLYPVAPGTTTAEHWLLTSSPTAHLLVRLRVWHPIVAVAVATGLLGLLSLAGRERTDARVVAARRGVRALVLLEVGAGLVNVVLSAPAWLQVLHLGLAQGVWLSWIAFGTALVLAPDVEPPAMPARTRKAAAGPNPKLSAERP